MADSFTLDIQRFADQFEGGAEEAIRGTSISLFSAIIKSSPVDEGRFRSNWFASGASIDTGTTENVVPESQSISTMIDKINGLQDWSTFTLTNNLPYSEVIEFGGFRDGPNTVGGFSRQAPTGVLRVNVTRFNALLEQEARRSLPR